MISTPARWTPRPRGRFRMSSSRSTSSSVEWRVPFADRDGVISPSRSYKRNLCGCTPYSSATTLIVYFFCVVLALAITAHSRSGFVVPFGTGFCHALLFVLLELDCCTFLVDQNSFETQRPGLYELCQLTSTRSEFTFPLGGSSLAPAIVLSHKGQKIRPNTEKDSEPYGAWVIDCDINPSIVTRP